METFSNDKMVVSERTLSLCNVDSVNTKTEIKTIETESCIESTDVTNHFEKETISNNDILQEKTTEIHISAIAISHENIKEDLISHKRLYIFNEVLAKEESEERINMMLILTTLPLSLILLGFITKILLVLPPIESEPLIFKRLEGIVRFQSCIAKIAFYE